MSIQPSQNAVASRYQSNSTQTSATQQAATQQTATQQTEESKKPSASELSAANRQQLNQTILDNQLSLSVKSDNKAMSLLYRSVSDAVEKRLAEQKPATDSAGVESPSNNNPYASEDTSPQATADRIVGFATNFYSAFRERNPGLSDEDSMDQFLTHIGSGIDKGFEDARNILKSLQKLDGKVADDIDETYQLIQKGLQDFKERTLNPKPAEPAA